MPQADFTPAKRGDLALFERVDSVTYADFRTVRSKSYAFAKVTSVTREGRVKAAEREQPAPWPWRFGGGQGCHVVPAAKLNGKTADSVLSDIYGASKSDFDSVDAARAAILGAVQ